MPRKKGPAKPSKRPITIRLDEETLLYCAGPCDETGIPPQTLINLYLRDCVEQERRIDLEWYAARQLADDRLW